jgi:hypothetical protein
VRVPCTMYRACLTYRGVARRAVRPGARGAGHVLKDCTNAPADPQALKQVRLWVSLVLGLIFGGGGGGLNDAT